MSLLLPVGVDAGHDRDIESLVCRLGTDVPASANPVEV